VKPQIHFSPDASDSPGSGEPVKRLSERYNIPEKDVEALLYGSRAPKGELGGSSTKDKTMPEIHNTNYGPNRGWSPLTVISLVLGILGIMALSIILFHMLHHERHEFPPRFGGNMPPQMMPAPYPQPQPTDTVRTPSPAMNQAPEEPRPEVRYPYSENPAPRKTHRPSTTSSGFSTSNSIEAQEKLAEMRADGNTKARIRSTKRNGVTIYNVR
jgi:hypothetical protein